MSNLSRYLKTIMPDSCTILGVVLRPFSIGHYLILSYYGSPFVSEKLEETNLEKTTQGDMWAQLIFALSVCRHSYEDFTLLINDPELFEKEKEKLNCNISKAIKAERKAKTFNPLQKFSLFRSYLEDGFQVPVWTFNNSSGTTNKPATRHWTEQLIEDLVSKGNRTRSEAMNMHLASAWKAWAHLAESEGAIDILSDEQAKEFEEALKTGKTNLTIEDPEGWQKLLQNWRENHPIESMGI